MCMGCIIVVCISMAAMAKSFYLEFWLLHFEIVVLKLYAIHTSAIKGTVEQDEKWKQGINKLICTKSGNRGMF